MTDFELTDQLDDLAEMVGVWSEVAGRARLFLANLDNRDIPPGHRFESETMFARNRSNADSMVDVLRSARRLLVNLLNALEDGDQTAVGQLIPQIVATNRHRVAIGVRIDAE